MYVQLKFEEEIDDINSFLLSFIGLIGSLNLFKSALSGVLGSPVSFFDTTPMGIKIALPSFNDELISFPQAESCRGCRKIRTLSIKSCP